MILGRLSVLLFSILVAFGPSAIFGGNYWINSFGSTGESEFGKDIVVDDNYVYVIGTFQGTVDFDAGSGTTVTNLTATAVVGKVIDIAWTAPNNGGSAITGYKIERSTDGTNYIIHVADTQDVAVAYSDINLTAGTTY